MLGVGRRATGEPQELSELPFDQACLQGLRRTEYLYFNLIHYTIRTFHAKMLVHAV